MEKLKLYTDGGSFNNGYKDPNKPMFGSFGCVVVKEDRILYKFSGFYEDITNNQGELFGFIKGYTEILKRYKSGKEYEIEVISDSQYLISGVNEWLKGWKKKNWKNSSGDEVKNKRMWLIIDALLKYEPNHKFIFTHQKGHKGKKVTQKENPNIFFNEMCDSLCQEALKDIDKAVIVHPSDSSKKQKEVSDESRVIFVPDDEFNMTLKKIEKILKNRKLLK